MSEPRIRWEPLLGGNFDGYAGTMTAPMFEVHLKVKRGAAETWALRSDLLRGYTTATHPDTLKATAERWLEEFISSLGASFPEPDARWSALKDYLTRQIEQDLAQHRHCLDAGETTAAASYGGLVSANRSTLAKMRELEAGHA